MFGIFRFVLACFVFLGHILGMRHAGGAAVFSFYLLSGFLMTLLMNERYSPSLRSRLSFLYHRFLRLWPMYIFAVIISLLGVILLGEEFTKSVNPKIYMPNAFNEWMWNLFIFSPSLQPIELTPRLVTPAWALTVEIVYYILICFGLSKTKQRAVIWVLVSLLIYFSTYFLGLQHGVRTKGLICASLPFSLGALYYYYKDFTPFGAWFSSVKVKMFSILGWSIIAIISYLILDNTSPASASILFDFALIPSLLCLIILYPSKKVSKTWMKLDYYLGSLSYPIYVLHWPVTLFIVYFLRLDPDLGLNSDGILTLIIGFVIISILGILFELLLEPKIKALRKFLN